MARFPLDFFKITHLVLSFSWSAVSAPGGGAAGSLCRSAVQPQLRGAGGQARPRDLLVDRRDQGGPPPEEPHGKEVKG
jgi:hypothetical protein